MCIIYIYIYTFDPVCVCINIYMLVYILTYIYIYTCLYIHILENIDNISLGKWLCWVDEGFQQEMNPWWTYPHHIIIYYIYKHQNQYSMVFSWVGWIVNCSTTSYSGWFYYNPVTLPVKLAVIGWIPMTWPAKPSWRQQNPGEQQRQPRRGR